MSLVVSAYGGNYVALGADHGTWDIGDDGKPYNSSTHSESKLREVPGCPMVMASVGAAGAARLIDSFIRRKAYTRETYLICDGLRELWHDMFDEYDKHARKRLAEAGFDPDKSIADALATENHEFMTAHERMVAGLQIISAGIDYIGLPRFFEVNYPSREITCVNVAVDGPFAGVFCSGIFAMGSHNILGGFGDTELDYTKLNSADAIELCRFMLDTVERGERLKEKTGVVRCVMPPYDLALITTGGVEWVQQ